MADQQTPWTACCQNDLTVDQPANPIDSHTSPPIILQATLEPDTANLREGTHLFACKRFRIIYAHKRTANLWNSIYYNIVIIVIIGIWHGFLSTKWTISVMIFFLFLFFLFWQKQSVILNFIYYALSGFGINAIRILYFERTSMKLIGYYVFHFQSSAEFICR